MSVFAQIEITDSIEMMRETMRESFVEDKFENKINLGLTSFRNEEGDAWSLPVVKQAEKVIASDETLNKAYLPVLGLESFRNVATKLLLGNESPALLEGRVFSAQVLSGTGGLRVAAEFLNKHLKYKTVYISKPGWRNNHLIFKSAKFDNIQYYRYWNINTKAFALEPMLDDLRRARDHAVIVLQTCAHNPTGCDPTKAQWIQIAKVVKEKQLFPLLYCPFQGIASGDLDEDAWIVRYFVSHGFEFFCSQALVKNFSFCNERIGNLVCVTKKGNVIKNVKSQLAFIITGLYSNPPVYGARIVTYILNDPRLRDEWKNNIKRMYLRCKQLKNNLRQALEKLGTPGNWAHITNQGGMFSQTGLTQQQCIYLMNTHHIYIRLCGRINLSTLNANNINHVAKAICDTVKSVPTKE
ncbi:aspartate aminotransferase [Holotrichia oblita]|uniref:Aspartate aminotransferase n=1 Tax=Holotrichia oblita TaxID=644536 RepID=A0ACB9TLX7_HOLOL|nr:aspartate aminotransferase [Holotrichia oblita]